MIKYIEPQRNVSGISITKKMKSPISMAYGFIIGNTSSRDPSVTFVLGFVLVLWVQRETNRI
jgi:hypothetical protein